MRTVAYIDGFNLYYGALKSTGWKWLDLVTLLKNLLQPHHKIVKVKYFTTKVSATGRDPSASERQDVYLQALQRYRPEVKVYFGHFMHHPVRMPLAEPFQDQRTAEVIKTEEKGSDVNLAVHLLNDAWLNVYDCAVLVSNDSDIAEAMRLVREYRRKPIGLLTPGDGRSSAQLLKHASFRRSIPESSLRESQLPDPIPGTDIRMPENWQSTEPAPSEESLIVELNDGSYAPADLRPAGSPAPG